MTAVGKQHIDCRWQPGNTGHAEPDAAKRMIFIISAQKPGGWFYINEVKDMQPDLIIMDKSLGWADGLRSVFYD